MSGFDDSSRRYGDREIGLILKRATEFQDETPEPSGTGLTVPELEDIVEVELASSQIADGGAQPRIGSGEPAGES